MKKNVAGQKIGAQLVSATDGSNFTGSVTVYVTGDAGTQAVGSVGSGACTHEGNGYHTYAPAQAETNYDLIAFTFIGSGAVSQTVQVYTDFPQTIDAADINTKLGTPAGASIAADIAGIDTKIGTPVITVSEDIANIQAAVISGTPEKTLAHEQTVTVGNVIGGSYLSTQALDGTYFNIRPTGSPLDVELLFNTGTSSISSVSIYGRYTAATNRFVNIYAWRYDTSVFELVTSSTTRMNHRTTDPATPYEIQLLSRHKDPVTKESRIRFLSDTGTNTYDLFLDAVWVYAVAAGLTASQVADAVALKMPYAQYGGYTWINTLSGFAGTDLNVNGLPNHPSNTEADALSIAAQLGINRFYCFTETELTLTQSYAGWVIDGWEFYINMGGQTLADTVFKNCHIEGVGICGADSDMHFENCYIASDDAGASTATICMAVANQCILVGEITLASGSNHFIRCVDGTDSTESPIIIFADAAEAQFRDYRGALHLKGLATGNDVIIDGEGRVIIDSTCTGGKVTIRGNFAKPVNQLGAPYSGAVTIVQTERISTDQPMILTTDYDAAKTAASQTSVDGIPTNPVLDNDTRLDDITKTTDIIDGTITRAKMDEIVVADIIGDEIEDSGNIKAYKQDGQAISFENNFTDTTREAV